jgi:RNA polymerase sigma-70 factor (ECF subfamily)
MPTQPATEAELLAAATQGGFEPLIRRYNRLLYRTARSIVRDDTEAQDILQDAYLQAFRSLPSFRGESSLSTWLTRIVINIALARVRKNTRRAEIIPLESAMPDENWPTEAEAPDASAMRADVRRLLEQQIDALPDVFRTVFMLRELEEMSVEEASVALGIPEATVRSRHFRARSMLREALSREMDMGMEDAFSFDGERCDRLTARVLAALDHPPGEQP